MKREDEYLYNFSNSEKDVKFTLNQQTRIDQIVSLQTAEGSWTDVDLIEKLFGT